MSFKEFSDKQNQASVAKTQEAHKKAANSNPKAVPSEKPSTTSAPNKQS